MRSSNPGTFRRWPGPIPGLNEIFVVPFACWRSALPVLAVGLALALPASAHGIGHLEKVLLQREPYVEFVREEARDFTLLDAEGRSIGLAGFRDKVVALNFIYASCPDLCPIQSDKIAEIQRLVNETPMRELVQFISVTTDPVRDTPDVLGSYAPAHGLDPANWMFLTSGADDPEATRALAADYGLEFTPGEAGYIMHGAVLFMIDRTGTIRARFHGLKFNSMNAVLYINALANDAH